MRKLCIFSFSFALAVFLSQFFLPLRFLPLAAVSALALGLAGYAAAKPDRRKAALIAAFGMAAGFVWNFGYDTLVFSRAQELDGVQAAVTATVSDFPVEQSYGSYVDIRVQTDGPFSLKARAYIYDDSADGLRPGDKIRFTALFSTADKVGENEITSYTSKGYLLFVRGVEGLEVLKSPGVTAANFHRYLARAIKEKIKAAFPLGAEGFMLALLTGDRSLLSGDDSATVALERTGLTHIVAVSGMHAAILAGFISTVLGKRRWTVIVTAPALLIFMAVSGFSASVVRAVVMQLFLLIAPLIMRESDSLTSLAAALLLLLLINPYAIAGVGLQLSFGATLGIILISPKINARLIKHAPKKKGFKRKIVLAVSGAVSTTMGALALTMPITAYYFQSVPLIAPLSNLLILWAVTPTFIIGAAAVGLAFIFLPAGRIVGFFPAILVKTILFTAKLLAKPDYACVYLTDPAMQWLFIAMYTVCAGLAIAKARLRAFIPVICAGTVALCGILVLRDLINRGQDGYELTVLDVGQGQSIAVTSAGYTAIIDCGSSSGQDAGRTAEYFLRGMGRGRVDVLILTHYHSDHANGVKRILSSLGVATLIVPEPRFTESDLDEEILAAAERCGTEVIFVTEETEVALGEASITLYPPMGADSENERGLMALVADDGFETLITGDAPGYLERQLTAKYELPDIECLIVGHHGSASSTTDRLLDAVTPETAIISVGDNSYGHPRSEVLERLGRRDITVLRTDEVGNITVSSR